MFWVPHPDAPVPVYEDILRAWGNGGIAIMTGIAAAIAGIPVFAFLNIKSLIWKIGRLAEFMETE